MFDVAESPLFHAQAKPDWKKFYALAWSASTIMDYIEGVMDDILRGNNTMKLPDIMKDMPQTVTFIEVLLRNLPAITRDLVDILTQKSPIQYITVISKHQKNEDEWPCVYKQSIGEAMELRTGTKAVVREMEKIFCDPSRFIKEWNEQPMLVRLVKIFQNDETGTWPAFNWTAGYTRLRRVIKKFDTLMDSPADVTLIDSNQVTVHTNNLFAQVRKIVEDAIPKVEEKATTFLDYFDLEIDKNIPVFKSNMTAKDAWLSMDKTRGLDEILVIVKYGSRVLHDAINVAREIFRGDATSINILDVLGFTSKSAVSIVHDRLPYIIATVIYGISDLDLDNKIYNTTDNNNGVTCSDVFMWFEDYKIGLTIEEYRTLKNFTCDSDPENFNGFVELYLKETMLWRTPVSDYRPFFLTLAGELHDFVQLVNTAVANGLKIDPPVDRQYFRYALNTLKNVLEVPRVFTPQPAKLDTEWSTYRLIVEGMSVVLNNAAFALKDIQLKDNVLHLWDFVRPGDSRKLLKHLEAYPNETISLFASLSTFNSTTLIPYKDLRHTICNLHFNSDYWVESKSKHFLSGLCTWDQTELLKSATSQDYVNLVQGKNISLQKIEPLSKSLTKFLDIWMKLEVSTYYKISVVSNIFNITTWQNLSNVTRKLIHNAEKSWIHKLILELSPLENEIIFQSFAELDYNSVHKLFANHPLNALRQIFQLGEFWTDIMSGGDIWQKFKTTFELSKVKVLLNLIEDSPNLIITLLDTFINSERLNDFAEKFLSGSVNACDIDKYLIPSSYIRKKGILGSITNFCQKIVYSNVTMDIQDFRPLVPSNSSYEKNIFDDINIKRGADRATVKVSLNETYFMDQVEKFQSTLVRVLSEGYKQPKTPSWWTSFQESTWNDFKKQFNSKDLRSLSHSVVIKSTKVMQNILSSTPELKTTCEWCNTRLIEIFNSQLTHHEVYSEIICKFQLMNVTQIQEIIDTRLYWKKTIGMIQNFEFLSPKKDVNNFINAIQDSLLYITDIIVDYHVPEKKLQECMLKAVDGVKNFSPAIYVKIIVGIIDSLRKNVILLHILGDRADVQNRTELAEKFVPIWQPLKNIVKESSLEEVNKLLPNAELNVNLLLTDMNNSLCQQIDHCNKNASIFNNFLSSKRVHKLLRYDPKLSNYPTSLVVSKLLATSLDFELINQEIYTWRNNASYNLAWLKEILQHLSVIFEEGGSLLNVASKIDFQDVSNVLGVPDLADGVVNLLRDKTVDKLFDGFKELLEDVVPFLPSEQVKHDLFLIVEAFESMEIFKNLGLLDMKYVVSEMFLDWNILRQYLVEKIKLSNDVMDILSHAKVDMLAVFMKERSAISITDTLCDKDNLEGMLDFEESKTNADEVSNVLCSLDSSATTNMTITLIQNVNFDYVFKNLMSANVKNILKNANLTETEGKVIFDNIGVVAELVPFFKNKLTSGLPSATSENTSENFELSSGKFLQDSSELLCGRQLISDSGEFYRIISSLKDKEKAFDERELNSLPTEFCRDTYKTVLGMNGGKIIWSYVKPLLRGRILYSPKAPVIGKVMMLANQTFNEIDIFGQLINSIEKTLVALVNLSDMGDSLNDLKEIMASKVMKLAIKSMSGGKMEGDLSNFDLGEMSWRLKQSGKLIGMIGMLNDFVECILVDRMIGFDTEEELEVEARKLTQTNEFLAGVVFLDFNSKRQRRSYDQGLPNDVTYKIRMDVDYVPSTKRLKSQFWLPGPEASFIEDLRYLRGFIQLQDSVDRAIIEVKSGKEQNWKTLSQQMPYPCWKFAPFQSTLYESQGLIVCFFFAMMMCVGSAVRYIVWERESQNAMVMSVMGLKPWRNTLAWFITSYIELTIVAVSIALILLVGKILPHSDPLLIMLLLMDYIFSIVTFCYMISTMFSSASLAAVTTVVMFLLTYMPYVIVIAMEASMGLGYNLLLVSIY